MKGMASLSHNAGSKIKPNKFSEEILSEEKVEKHINKLQKMSTQPLWKVLGNQNGSSKMIPSPISKINHFDKKQEAMILQPLKSTKNGSIKHNFQSHEILVKSVNDQPFKSENKTV